MGGPAIDLLIAPERWFIRAQKLTRFDPKAKLVLMLKSKLDCFVGGLVITPNNPFIFIPFFRLDSRLV